MKYLIVLSILCFFLHVQAKEGKFLSMFNIVRFPNDACDAGGNKNGTCYTKDECDQRGGTNEGSCAEGYGVCCTFTAYCGDVSSENNTYFESDGDEKGHCTLKVCKNKPSIVQLRLDFETFNINGPSTASITENVVSNNVVIGGTGTPKVGNLNTACLTDSFSVSNPGGQSPPVICGNNNDYHMYVEASEDCNSLTFVLADNVISTFSRSWTVRVTQYDEGFENLAPPGCTQYFWDKEDSDGYIESYNRKGSVHLADQKQVICIRREENKNRICYELDQNSDFQISGDKASPAVQPYCGGYNTAGDLTYADALLIQSAVTTGAPASSLGASNLCGQSGFLKGAGGGGTPTQVGKICSSSVPFRLTFVSDTFEENAAEWANGGNTGFRIKYTQS